MCGRPAHLQTKVETPLDEGGASLWMTDPKPAAPSCPHRRPSLDRVGAVSFLPGEIADTRPP